MSFCVSEALEDTLQCTAHLGHCRSCTLVTHLPFKAHMYLPFISEIWVPSSGSQWLFKEQKAREQGAAHHSCLKYQDYICLHLSHHLDSQLMHLPIFQSPKISEDPPPHVDLSPFWNSHLFLLSLCSLAQVIFQLIPSTSPFQSVPGWEADSLSEEHKQQFGVLSLSLPSWQTPVPVTPCTFSHKFLPGQLPALPVWHLHHTLKWHDWKTSSSAALSHGLENQVMFSWLWNKMTPAVCKANNAEIIRHFLVNHFTEKAYGLAWKCWRGTRQEEMHRNRSFAVVFCSPHYIVAVYIPHKSI